MHKRKRKGKHFCLKALDFSQTRSQRIVPCRPYSYKSCLRNWTQRRVSIRILVPPLLPYGTRVEHGLGLGRFRQSTRVRLRTYGGAQPGPRRSEATRPRSHGQPRQRQPGGSEEGPRVAGGHVRVCRRPRPSGRWRRAYCGGGAAAALLLGHGGMETDDNADTGG
jgi:hypothetical protein